jgi:hypothetical protein
MALYRPVATAADLPAPGAGRESGTYDFKGAVDPTAGPKRRELAKDVAAFANATGGVILVGAVEDPATGALERYSGMKEDFAERVKAAYDAAVADLCRPQPVADAVRIKAPAPFEGFVVAVNVNATPLSPIGVRWIDDPKNAAWVFPLRTTTHTTHLSPTELPMLMVPEVRRVAIILDSIPLDERVDIEIVSRGRGGALAGVIPRVQLLGIDERLTTVRLGWSSHEHRPIVTSTIPIDRVKSVWQREPRRWNLGIDGVIEGAGDRLLFFPP